MKTSVCLPSFNGERFLTPCIESILAQTDGDLELVITDDQSEDGTWDIVQSFRDPRIRATRNSRRLGIPGNWNKAIEISRGEFLCVFHQDDVMDSRNLAEKSRVLSANPDVSWVHSGIRLDVLDDLPSPAPWVEDSTEPRLFEGREYFLRLLLRGNLVCAPSVLTRRDLLLRAGGFNAALSFTPDYEMWMKLCLMGRAGFLPAPLITYRWHLRNASREFPYELDVEEYHKAAIHALNALSMSESGDRDVAVLREAVEAVTHWRLRLAAAYRELDAAVRWGGENKRAYDEVKEYHDRESGNWMRTEEALRAHVDDAEQRVRAYAEQLGIATRLLRRLPVRIGHGCALLLDRIRRRFS